MCIIGLMIYDTVLVEHHPSVGLFTFFRSVGHQCSFVVLISVPGQYIVKWLGFRKLKRFHHVITYVVFPFTTL